MLSAPAPIATSVSPSRIAERRDDRLASRCAQGRLTVRQGVPTGSLLRALRRARYTCRARRRGSRCEYDVPDRRRSIFARATASLSDPPSFVGGMSLSSCRSPRSRCEHRPSTHDSRCAMKPLYLMRRGAGVRPRSPKGRGASEAQHLHFCQSPRLELEPSSMCTTPSISGARRLSVPLLLPPSPRHQYLDGLSQLSLKTRALIFSCSA